MFLRTASERDLPAVRALLIEIWHATYDGIYGSACVTAVNDEQHSIAALKFRLGRPNSEFLVADDGKQLGATAYAAATSDPKVVMLQQLGVHPSFQRTGLGGLLFAELEESFPDARTLWLAVEAANAGAIAFFAKQGFVKTGDIADHGDPPTGMPVVSMEKQLG